jgi:mono/diheme cytochrome c family protein
MKYWIVGLAALAGISVCSAKGMQTEGPEPGARPVLTAHVPEAEIATASRGKKVFYHWCVECHGDGPRFPGTASLAAKYGKSMPAPLEQRTDLTPEFVSTFVRNGVSIMPPFRKTEVTDGDLAALGAYLGHRPEPAGQ